MTTLREKEEESSSSNSSETSIKDDISSNDVLRHNSNLLVSTLTSLVWLVMIFLSVFLVSQYYSPTNCAQIHFAHSLLCEISHVFTQFCSDSENQDLKETNIVEDFPNKVYHDIYEQHSMDERVFRIPDQSLLSNENPSSWPGEMGQGHTLPEHLQDESKRRFAENMFDIVVSDQIALDRSMPDIRNDHCKAHSIFDKNLPNTSIIIVFHNEGNSTLLRTLVSIVNRTPWELIHEIILLDDASVDREYLHGPLERFLKTLPIRTILYRNEIRLGLISSRVKGAKMATGETLTFLDSHVEVLNGWLLYLLDEIQKDRKTIMCPVIDVLTWDTFQLSYGDTDIIGTFNWRMTFRWSKLPERSTIDKAQPVRTPTMAGGLYTIDRLYFEELGMYDEGIQIWGGENLEMSFKCWMCGGRILIHPCSHVAHIFRKETPYKFLQSESIHATIFKNYKRVVLVWLDQYKQLIYAVNPDIQNLDGGDVSQRIQLRQKLNCSSFTNYIQMFNLTNFPLNYRFIGSISTSNDRCLDTMMGSDISEAINTEVSLQTCHRNGGNQIFLYTKSNKIHFDELCFEANNQKIIFAICDDNRIEQNWIYDLQTFQLKNEYYHEQCLTYSDTSTVTLVQCEITNSNQQWIFNQEAQLDAE